MIKVLIVDDEPFIRQGLKILINWNQYGFEVAGEAANGKEAVELMKSNVFDLVITDIKMPQMDGLELIEYTREHLSGKVGFIILSGFYEFDYAKKAIRFGVVDYVLKPIQKDELVRALEDYKERYYAAKESQRKLEYSEKILLDRSISNLINGNYVEDDLMYVKRYIQGDTDIRYIRIEYDLADETFLNITNEEKKKATNFLYNTLKDCLGDNWYHIYKEMNSYDDDYSVGFIYVKKMAELAGMNEKEYINWLYEKISEKINYKLVLFIGQKMDKLETISESYKSATIAKAFRKFSKEKDISYYDEIQEITITNKNSFDKEVMDVLIRAIEENDIEGINRQIEVLYKHFKEMVVEPDIIKINLDYLIYNLIHIAKELDPDSDQEEVYKMISQGGYKQFAVRGSIKHFQEFAIEFSNYLSQIRQHAFGGVLSEIEKEITEHYMDNLTLKSLSEKYYINSAYLGQIFKKKYGSSFKDYLNNYRIERAAELLIRSDDKIYLVSSAVGFNNTDYFISKFVQQKGITPLQYRKQFLTAKRS